MVSQLVSSLDATWEYLANNSTRLHPPDKSFGTCWPISITLPGVTGSYLFHLHFQLDSTVHHFLLDINSAAVVDSLPSSPWTVRHCASRLQPCSSFSSVLYPGALSRLRYTLCQADSGPRRSIRTSRDIIRHPDSGTRSCQCLEATKFDQHLEPGIATAIVLCRAFCACFNILWLGLFSRAVCAAVCLRGYWGFSG